MIYYSDNVNFDSERYIRDQEKQLARLPVCDCCGEHIQDETAFHYGSMWLCNECVNDNTEYVEADDEELF